MSPETITTIGSMDSGLALRAPRNDGCESRPGYEVTDSIFKQRCHGHGFAISRRVPESCWNVLPSKESEGAGNAGRALRPQPRVQNKNKHTSIVTTVTPVSPGIPRAMVLTVSFVLSPACEF
jgi:hypothetical protein